MSLLLLKQVAFTSRFTNNVSDGLWSAQVPKTAFVEGLASRRVPDNRSGICMQRLR